MFALTTTMFILSFTLIVLGVHGIVALQPKRKRRPALRHKRVRLGDGTDILVAQFVELEYGHIKRPSEGVGCRKQRLGRRNYMVRIEDHIR